MKKILFLLITLPIFGYAQYWQQEVNYTIDVKLNDKNHSLKAFEKIIYTNNSNETLHELYFHLWPNAYKNDKTALAKQLIHSGSKELVYAADSTRGWIDSLDFKVDGKQVKWSFDKKNIDIAILKLNAPLLAKQQIEITTPFYVKIPDANISRLGHVGQSYQITQWYPKPAVFDKNGWHPMPYLNQGEFYSEYGSFEVNITLPKNYIVGATGDLQNEEEIAFLNQIAEKTAEELKDSTQLMKKVKNDFPPSSNDYKTISYKQQNVHDFAWFADKRFQILKGEVELPHSKEKVITWAMFTPKNRQLWSKSLEYMHDGVYYYSLWNGDYPYKQVTAVDGTIAAGGGMEYPNVTIIGNTGNAFDLEVVIVHEIGHNWFYGILGSNERDNGWMDEGLNTLNELRYVYTKYPDRKPAYAIQSLHFEDINHYKTACLSYKASATLSSDQAIQTHSADFSGANYGFIMYQKTGIVFTHLKNYLGEEVFDKKMQNYFNQWKFKHPNPSDLKAVFSENENMDWIFEDLINTTNYIDYKINRVKVKHNETQIKFKNVGQVSSPIQVFIEGEKNDVLWLKGFPKKHTLTIPYKVERVKIDKNQVSPELFYKNNSWTKANLFNRKEKTKIEFLFGDNEFDKNNLFWSPMIATNTTDKFMLGALIHNYAVPFNRFQFFISPLFSFGRLNIAGVSEMSYSYFPKKLFKTVKIGNSISSFGMNKNETDYYVASKPYIRFEIGKNKKDNGIRNSLELRTIYRYDMVDYAKNELFGAYGIYDLNIEQLRHKLNFKTRFDYLDNVNNINKMNRTSSTITYQFNYLKKRDHYIQMRLFYGSAINLVSQNNTNISELLGSMWSLNGQNGLSDIYVEDFYFNRGGFNRTSRNAENMANLHIGNEGSFYTSSSVTSMNIYIPLPFKKEYIGLYSDIAISNSMTYHVSGIALKVKDIAAIYVPIYSSFFGNELNFKQSMENIRISFHLNYFSKKLNVFNLIQ